MGELFEAIFQSVNLPFTLLLILVVIYWLSVISGFLDFDALDVDVDFDTDVDLDADAEVGTLGVVAQFFGIGHLPIAIPFSVLFLCLWVGSVLLNDFFNPGMTWPRAGLLFIPNLFIALTLTKICCQPLIVLFRKLNHQPEDHLQAVGSICTIISPRVDGGLGQAEVPTDGAPLLLTVRREAGPVLERGDEAVVVSRDPNKDCFIIRKLEELS